MIYVNEKDLVIPGEVLAEDDYYSGRGTFEENGKICSKLLGLVSLRNKKVSVVPLKSKYLPKKGDVVIGKISDVRFSMWEVDLNSPYSGILPASEVFGRDKKELSRVFDVGDVLFLRIVDVDEVKKVKLGLKGRGMGKFKGGIVVDIAPTKVPRLIGKKGSMINMIKNKTGCKIVVGQNGLVWVKGDDDMEQIVRNTIKLIEKEAHTSGLTDRIKNKLCLEIDGELPVDEEHLAAEEEKLNEEAVDEGLKAPELQDFRDEIEEELAAEEEFDDEDSEDDFDDEDFDEEEVEDVKEDAGDEDIEDVEEESEEVDDAEDESEDSEDVEADEEVSEDEDSEDVEADEEVSEDEDAEDESEDSEDVEADEEVSEDEDAEKDKEHKFIKKQKFLDTFESIKQQEKKNKSSFGVSHADNSNSPTINLTGNESKSPQWRKSL